MCTGTRLTTGYRYTTLVDATCSGNYSHYLCYIVAINSCGFMHDCQSVGMAKIQCMHVTTIKLISGRMNAKLTANHDPITRISNVLRRPNCCRLPNGNDGNVVGALNCFGDFTSFPGVIAVPAGRPSK